MHGVRRDCYEFVICPNARHYQGYMRLPRSARRPAASLGSTCGVEVPKYGIGNQAGTVSSRNFFTEETIDRIRVAPIQRLGASTGRWIRSLIDDRNSWHRVRTTVVIRIARPASA